MELTLTIEHQVALLFLIDAYSGTVTYCRISFCLCSIAALDFLLFSIPCREINSNIRNVQTETQRLTQCL